MEGEFLLDDLRDRIQNLLKNLIKQSLIDITFTTRHFRTLHLLLALNHRSSSPENHTHIYGSEDHEFSGYNSF